MNDTSFESLVPFLKEKGVGMINASPLGMGLFTERGPASGHPATEEIKRVCAEAVTFCSEKGEDISKLAMQFGLANPDFATTLVGTTRTEHLKDNIGWLESPIDEDLLAEVLEILKPIRDTTWKRGLPENN